MTNDVSAEHLLAALLDVWESAKAEANTFIPALRAQIAAARTLIKTGAIAAVSKNSANQTYKNRESGSPTQGQTVEVYVQLLALYGEWKAKITAEFTASADFDYTVPTGFDFDVPIVGDSDPLTGFLTKNLLAAVSGLATQLPDIREMRTPICQPA